MKTVIDLVKSNPFITVCAFVALIGLVGMGYVRFAMVPSFAADAEEELKQISNRQKQLASARVQLPNKDINAQPIIEVTVINDKVISGVSNLYSTIGTQYDRIKGGVVDLNAQRHQPLMLGGGEIWPDKTNFAAYVQAVEDYKNHFEALFSETPNAWGMPRFIASGPPTRSEVDQVLASTSFNFISSNGITSAAALDKGQAKMLYDEQRYQLVGLLANRARNIQLYVDLPAEQDPYAVIEEDEADAAPTGGLVNARNRGEKEDRFPDGYPFQVAEWAFAETRPQPDQLWEGQVQLWIMRDIMQAIADLNQVETGVEVINDQGVAERQTANVLNSPVKRLLKLETLPGYVGLHTVGAVFMDNSENKGNAAFGGVATGLGNNGGSVYPDPPVELKPKKADEQAVSNFGISPTGHISNAAYDVRHTRLVIDIQWADLPDFMEKLREINFMNVIKVDIEDLDEYELLREGYVYGEEDVVRADLLIESLWFREWTQGYMPKIVRQKLLIELPEGEQSSQSSPFN